jgi:hypothetical protein
MFFSEETVKLKNVGLKYYFVTKVTKLNTILAIPGD